MKDFGRGGIIVNPALESQVGCCPVNPEVIMPLSKINIDARLSEAVASPAIDGQHLCQLYSQLKKEIDARGKIVH